MPQVTSADGTTLGYDRLGNGGPVVVLVGGGLDDGTENTPLGEHLAATFTVVNYQRRGRGNSGDTQPYAVQREIEDLAAIIDATGEPGGGVHLFGASSGGALALLAGAAGLPVDRIAVHEVPYQVSGEMLASWRSYTQELDAALAAGDRDQALRVFMRFAGSTDEGIADAETSHFWPPLRALAPTLAYDAACLGDGAPPAELEAVTQPVLLTTGATIDPHMAGLPVDYFGAAADAAAARLPHAERATIEVSGHIPDPGLLSDLLTTFYAR